MPQYDYTIDAIPYGSLGIIALESSREIGNKINDYIVEWRKDRDNQNQSAIAFADYKRDSYLLEASCPRFGTGEAKGLIKESVRGTDLYLLVDVF